MSTNKSKGVILQKKLFKVLDLLQEVSVEIGVVDKKCCSACGRNDPVNYQEAQALSQVDGYVSKIRRLALGDYFTGKPPRDAKKSLAQQNSDSERTDRDDWAGDGL